MIGRRFLCLAAALAATLLASRSASAQLEMRRGAISGRVHLADNSPVVGAQVAIVGRFGERFTSETGEFRFENIQPGRYELRVRRIGLQQLVKMVTIAPGETAFNQWEMTSVPQLLAEVNVHGRKVRVIPEFQEPFRRAAYGFGDYFLRDEITRRHPLDTKSILYEVPGVRVNERGLQFERCGTSLAAPAVVGGSQAAGEVVNEASGSSRITSSSLNGSGVQVYVDGHRMTGLNWTVDDVLRTVHPDEIEIMEVYRGVARIPIEFLDNACAVIAIWTRRG